MSISKTKNSLRTIEAQIVQKLKNNEARPKFTGSYKKKACICLHLLLMMKRAKLFFHEACFNINLKVRQQERALLKNPRLVMLTKIVLGIS